MKVLLSAIVLIAGPMFAAESTSTPAPATAAGAINALGVDLLQKTGKADANFLLSPYSIQCALAMTYAGADGATRTEMARVLHYPANDAELHGSFAALQKALEGLMRESVLRVEQMKTRGMTRDPLVLTVANRLFGQTGFDFRASFLELVKENYGAALEPLDFFKDAAGAAKHINEWVEQQTRDRIRNLIPDGALDRTTTLVLVNAIYLKAPWAEVFPEAATAPRPFHVAGGAGVDVPTMTSKRPVGYARRDGFTLVTIPYGDQDLQFLILLPDEVNGLAALETKLTAAMLAESARQPTKQAILFLPKFKLEPPAYALGRVLQSLGMKSAFDQPAGSANFDRMAPRKSGKALAISEVFHKTFLSLDEKGTEAAAATAVLVRATSAGIAEPIQVTVDHPFLFAIQHRSTGACLFLGHVADPR